MNFLRTMEQHWSPRRSFAGLWTALNSIGVHGASMLSIGASMVPKGIRGASLDFNGVQGLPKDFIGVQCSATEFNGVQRSPLKFIGVQCSPMADHGVQKEAKALRGVQILQLASVALAWCLLFSSQSQGQLARRHVAKKKLTAPAVLTLDPGGPQSDFWPSAHQGAVFQFFLEATGGTPPYTYTLNNAPDGIALVPTVDPNGVQTMKLYGKVHASVGKHNISVEVTDAAGNTAVRSKPIHVCAGYIDNEYTSTQPCI